MCEEIVFRGILLSYVRRISRSWTVAIVVSSCVFALPHVFDQEAATCVPLFCVGGVWAIFTLWRRSLVPAIVGHTLFNFPQIIYLLYLVE